MNRKELTRVTARAHRLIRHHFTELVRAGMLGEASELTRLGLMLNLVEVAVSDYLLSDPERDKRKSCSKATFRSASFQCYHGV